MQTQRMDMKRTFSNNQIWSYWSPRVLLSHLLIDDCHFIFLSSIILQTMGNWQSSLTEPLTSSVLSSFELARKYLLPLLIGSFRKGISGRVLKLMLTNHMDKTGARMWDYWTQHPTNLAIHDLSDTLNLLLTLAPISSPSLLILTLR